VGEFLKPCGNQVQVSCHFPLVLGFSLWKAMGWKALWGQVDAEECVFKI
jgi:hypothetical protein